MHNRMLPENTTTLQAHDLIFGRGVLTIEKDQLHTTHIGIKKKFTDRETFMVCRTDNLSKEFFRKYFNEADSLSNRMLEIKYEAENPVGRNIDFKTYAFLLESEWEPKNENDLWMGLTLVFKLKGLEIIDDK